VLACWALAGLLALALAGLRTPAAQRSDALAVAA
jgi:hypothetical protein